MADDDDHAPQYTLYRSRPKLFERREKAPEEPRRPDEPPRGPRRRPRLPGLPGLQPRLLAKYVLTFLAVWLGVSLVAFLVSAQIESAKTSSAADDALGSGGYTFTSANTILVLGSDARPRGTKEAGAQTIGQPSRSDSILLLRIGGGANATLSIPRDTVVDIPGHGRDKINAAYAYGGPALAIRTVEGYLGVEVNHLIEVNFENFPQLIDALGGITYRGGCVVSRLNGGFANGGYTLRLKGGEQEIDGRQALALARTRKNECNPRESDLSRARRQQKILNATKDKVASLETFVRLPYVAWTAPKAIRSDMAGPSLLGVVGAELIAGGASPQVLKPDGTATTPGGGAGLTVSDRTRRAAVRRFLKG